jgi:cytochrome bd-type quinol oxidase subunit 2
MTTTQQPPTREQALRTARLIWLALLIGQLVFLVVVLIVKRPVATTSSAGIAPHDLLFYVSIALLVGGVSAGWFLRQKLFATREADGSLAPSKYVTGTIIFLALCEGPALLSLVSVLLAGMMFPYLLPAVVAMVIQGMSYPSGSELGLG